MMIVLILFIGVFLTLSNADPITLNCTFEYTLDSDYSCKLSYIEFLDPSQEVIFDGEHLEGKINADVEAVVIIVSNTPFMIPQMFTTFPSMIELTIIGSKLESIEVPDLIQLRRLTIDLNPFIHIKKGMLNNQKKLEWFSAIGNGIRLIDEDAFEGLDKLTFLGLDFNYITEFASKTLQHLPSLVTFTMEHNQLMRIDDELFSKNTNLRRIALASNLISAISPKFSRAFLENLENIDLSYNLCVRRNFRFEDKESLLLMHNILRSCYNNFNGGTVDERTITQKFKGSMAMYDEFGNIVGRVN